LTRWEFRELLEIGAAAYIQPDVSHTGGITELKKISNLAEIYYVHTLPHSAIGPVAFTASMHVDASVPNFLMQEQIDQALGHGLLQEPWKVNNGFIDLPSASGLGFDVIADAAEKDIGVYEEELGGELYHSSYGSVADW